MKRAHSTAGQTRTQSAVETAANIAIGFLINFFAQLLLYPLFGIRIGLATNFLIGAAFTAISVVRHFSLRRLFNWIHVIGSVRP